MAADTREDFNSVFESNLQSVLPRFGVKELKDEQKAALVYVLSGKDLFVSLSTGFGKSLIYQLAPLVAEELFQRQNGNTRTAIVSVISPLVLVVSCTRDFPLMTFFQGKHTRLLSSIAAFSCCFLNSASMEKEKRPSTLIYSRVP